MGARGRPALAAAVAIALLVIAGAGLRGVDTLVAARRIDSDVARWAESQIPAGANTLSFAVTLTLEHGTRLVPRDLYLLTPGEIDRMLASGQPVFVLVQVDAMAGQWADRPPGVNFRHLRDGVGLTTVGARQGYTLFRAGPPGP
jgi:hypothetical protein